MFRKAALALSALAVVASLGLAGTSASAHPIFPHPHVHGGFGRGGFGRLGLFGAVGAIAATAVIAEQPDCWLQQQVVEGPDGAFLQNVTVCN
jgi:hypothetical protein